MSDEWEQQRLETRDSFIDRHRIRLSVGDSELWEDRNKKLDMAFDDLLAASKELKIALKEIANAPKVDSNNSLREIYSSVSRQNLHTAQDANESQSYVQADLDNARELSLAFGTAIGSIMLINRLVLGINEIKLDVSNLHRRFRNLALHKMGDYASEYEKATLPLSLANGEIIYLKPDFEVVLLSEISLSGSLSSLRAWRAVSS